MTMQAMQVHNLFSMLKNSAVKKSFQEKLPPAWQRAGAEVSWPGLRSLPASCAVRAGRQPRPASCSGRGGVHLSLGHRLIRLCSGSPLPAAPLDLHQSSCMSAN